MRRIKGFTLIELILVIVVLGVVGSMAGTMMYQAVKASNMQYDLGSLDGQARVALEKMTRELRTIRSNSAADLSIAADQITFTDTTNNTITYAIAGDELMRNSQPLATGVSTLHFTYSDATGAETAIPTQIRFITISLTMTKGGHTVSLDTSISPRNFR